MLRTPAAAADRRSLARFTNAGIESVYQANRAATTDDQRFALESLDTTVSGRWSQITWDQLARSGAERIYHPERINQNPLGLCGPAAVLNYIADATPGTFSYIVEAIYRDGRWGSDEINSTLRGNTVMGSMDPLDWMMLSAMQDTANSVLSYYGRQTKFRDGESIGDLQRTMTSFSHIGYTTEYSCGYWGVEDQTRRVNELLRQNGKDVCVVMEVDSTTLQNESARGSNDHFIRLLRPITYGANTVSFDVFTWGANRSYTFQRANFDHMVDGYVVGSRHDIGL